MLGNERKDDFLVEPLIIVANNDKKNSEYNNDEVNIVSEEDGIDRIISSSSSSSSSVFSSLLSEVWNSVDQRMALISGFSTSYNVVNISMVLPILLLSSSSSVVSTTTNDDGGVNNNNKSSSGVVVGWETSLCASLLLGGMIVGQLLGGWLGDVIGRSAALYTVMSLQFIGSLGSAFLTTNNSSTTSLETLLFRLSMWRLVLGIGAGGVYPLQAILSAEATAQGEGGERGDDDNNNNNNNNKEKLMSLVFSIQGVAFLSVPLITLLLLTLFPTRHSLVWKILLALGAIPSLLLFISIYFCKKSNSNTNITNNNNNNNNNNNTHTNTTDAATESSLAGNHNNHNNNDHHHHHHHSSSSLHHHTLRREHHDGKEYLESIDVIKNPLHRHSLQQQEESDNGSIVVEEQSSIVDNNNNNNKNNNDKRTEKQFNMMEKKSGLLDSIRSEPQVIKKLFGTAMTWFLFDILFYGNTLFQPIVLQAAFFDPNNNNNNSVIMNNNSTKPHDMLLVVSHQQLLASHESFQFSSSSSLHNNNNNNHAHHHHQTILSTVYHSIFINCLALPGYILSFLLMGKQTRICSLRKFTVIQSPRYIQIQGFICMAILYASIALLWNQFCHSSSSSSSSKEGGGNLLLLLRLLKKVSLIGLYGGTFFFANYGPNTTTFLMPSLVFSSPKCRSTLNGISAAMGKTGALFGAILFTPINNHLGSNYVMAICAITSILAAIITILFIPPPPPSPPSSQQQTLQNLPLTATLA